PREAPGTRAPGAGGADTVGAVAFDGETFAAAGSTGGLVAVLDGRVSDVGLPGCGLDASDAGAVCVTGAGNDILRARVASRVLRLVEGGEAPRRAAERALAWLPPGRALGILVATREEHAAASRSPFPWAAAEEGR
ncbi:MAG TPA: isoaspartyl peptidase/L-asparaginase, partial [Candidatus Thermoplasmatota archaeon]|nr:isoaspartyl peptidase/L-asparaginase [Candidatus Thermoplasmatota archaeon]